MVRERVRVCIYLLLTRTDNRECYTNSIVKFLFAQEDIKQQIEIQCSGREVEILQTFPKVLLASHFFLWDFIRTCWDEYISHVTETARISNSIWNFRIRSGIIEFEQVFHLASARNLSFSSSSTFEK